MLVNKRVHEDESATQTMPDQTTLEEKVSALNSKKQKAFEMENVNIIDIISSDYFNGTPVTAEDVTGATLVAPSTKSPSSQTPSPSNKITCNGVEMIREKVVPSPHAEKYVYDIYFTKNADLHLDLLYSNNYEIKSSNNYDHVELVDENGLGRNDEECK